MSADTPDRPGPTDAPRDELPPERAPEVSASGPVPREARGTAPRSTPHLQGPGDHGSLRTRGLTASLRMFLRPALDRMPPDQSSLGRLRALTSGAGRAAALESTSDWSADGPVPGLWVGRKRFNATDKVLYFLHGGGFTFGSPWSHKALSAQLSKESSVPVFLPDYRLAPEHPFPAAIEDAVAGWHWLREMGYAPENIVVLGDSAGGNLALQVVSALAEAGDRMPAGMVLMSPWVDMDIEDITARDRARKDPFLAVKLIETCRQQYAPDVAPDDPRISPVHLRPTPDWPPVLLQCGGEEIFRGGIEMLARNLDHHGVTHEFQIWPNQFHVFQAFHPVVPEARVAIRDIGAFLRGCLH